MTEEAPEAMNGGNSFAKLITFPSAAAVYSTCQALCRFIGHASFVGKINRFEFKQISPCMSAFLYNTQ